MNRSYIEVAGAILTLTQILSGQVMTVVGTNNAKVDIPTVQAAVNQGGHVVLKGHFSFAAPPTVSEQPSLFFSGAALGMVLVSKTVTISGALDDGGEMASIEGGANPFYVEAPGAHITIQGLHFIHSKALVIRVVAAQGLVITSNRIEGVASDAPFAMAIEVNTTPGDNPPTATDLGQSGNVSGTLFIANNDIDLQGADDANYLGIGVFGAGQSPDKEVDLYISGNNIRNSTERPINVYAVGGRVYIQRNVVTTGLIGHNVSPSGDVIHVVGPGSFLIAQNTIDCAWTSGLHAGIRLQSRANEAVSHAIVVDNDINMSVPAGTVFDVTSAAIEVRGAGEGNMVMNNRIRGHANFALSVITQNGAPQGTEFIMNDLQGFEAARADVYVDAGGTNTIALGGQTIVEDHGVGTLLLPVH
jgi:hypothetical protein